MPRAHSSIAARFALVATVLGVLAGGMAACGSSSDSAGSPPVTGITVRAETITAGHGCGTAPTQIFKFAVIFKADDQYVGGNVYDCFTDGTFVKRADIATSHYTMEVFAYNQVAYLGSGNLLAIMGALADDDRALRQDGGAAERDRIEKDLERIRDSKPTYSTTCTADQLDLVQALAVCEPLTPSAP